MSVIPHTGWKLKFIANFIIGSCGMLYIDTDWMKGWDFKIIYSHFWLVIHALLEKNN